MKTKQLFIMSLTVAVAAVLFAGSAFAEISKEVLDSIQYRVSEVRPIGEKGELR